MCICWKYLTIVYHALDITDDSLYWLFNNYINFTITSFSLKDDQRAKGCAIYNTRILIYNLGVGNETNKKLANAKWKVMVWWND